MIIIILGMLIALSYIYQGMRSQRSMLSSKSANAAAKALSENLAHTGIQFAINKYDDDKSWRGPQKVNMDEGAFTISLKEVKGGDQIKITSTGKMGSREKHTMNSTLEVNDNDDVIPTFASSMSLATDNFNISKMGGAMSINGNAPQGSSCSDMPGISVKDKSGKQEIEQNANSGGGSNKKGISGNPAVGVDDSLSYSPMDETVERLVRRGINVENKFDIAKSRPNDPKTFVLDSGVQLNGNIEGYGILIVKDGGRINGNFTFNGLVIFEDEDMILGNGTADLNGSVLVGTPGSSNVDISLNGNISLQYDCRKQQYADLAAKNTLKRTYSMVSIYQ